MSLETTLSSRRSIRDLSTQPLSQDELGQLLWAAQGVTDSRGYRTAPSAGALYPLEVYAVVGRGADLDSGVYRYLPEQHALAPTLEGDKRDALAVAALGQSWVKRSAVLLVITAVEKRTTKKYGRRGIRYIHIEVGHVSQNVFLQAVAMNLGAAVVGAFDDERVAEILELPSGERPLYLMPIGRMR